MDTPILFIFLIVYLGMIIGGIPFLQLDRTGVALLGAITLISMSLISLEDAIHAIDWPTMILLFAFMVISAQIRLSGLYDWITHKLTHHPLSPPRLLGVLMLSAAGLSAIFSNDIVCLAIAPILIKACRKRFLNPIPFLLALACAANIGSAATLIGNPQNILIGQTLKLSFAGYLTEAMLPVTLGLLVSWVVIVLQTRGSWHRVGQISGSFQREEEAVPLDKWQATKGILVTTVLLILFLIAPWPREHIALIGAGVLLMSRKLHATKMLGLVDWQVLVLFAGLFIVNHALQTTGVPTHAIRHLAALGVYLNQPGPLFGATLLLSNMISNVPAVMLLLPAAKHEMAGPLLALVSTLSGNLLIVGSIANILVVDAAKKCNIPIDWRQHAHAGIPITIATLAIAGVYLAARLYLH